MTKFKYNYLDKTLWKIEGDYLYEIYEENQFTNEHGAKGFILSPANHWITFKVYSQKIKAFYKKVDRAGEITYYQKEMPLIPLPLVPLKNLPLKVPWQYRNIEFEFSEKDEVWKNTEGNWTKK